MQIFPKCVPFHTPGQLCRNSLSQKDAICSSSKRKLYFNLHVYLAMLNCDGSNNAVPFVNGPVSMYMVKRNMTIYD